MRIDIAVAYKAYGRVQGSRMSSSVGFSETVGYEIPELDDGDAPVVLTWTDEAPRHLTSETELGVGVGTLDSKPYAIYHGPEVVRMHRGEYWRPLRSYEFLIDAPEDISAIDVNGFVRGLTRHQAQTISVWQNANTRKNRVPEQHFSAVERTNRSIAIREVGKFLSRFRLIGDEVYVRCGQPVVVFDDRRFGRTALPGETGSIFDNGTRKFKTWYSNTVRILTSERDERFVRRNLFYPIQMIDEVIKKVKRLNAQKAPEFKEMANAFNAERVPHFVDPEFAARAEEDECAINLRRFIAIVESNPADLLPADDHYRLKLFCDLTEALKMIPDAEGFDLLETAGREYLENYSEYSDYHHREQEALKRAIEIAESREVTLDAAFTTRSGPSMR